MISFGQHKSYIPDYVCKTTTVKNATASSAYMWNHFAQENLECSRESSEKQIKGFRYNKSAMQMDSMTTSAE